MGGLKPLALTLAAAAAAAAGPSPARGQCRLCSTPTAAVPDTRAEAEGPGIKIETSLNFDRLILLGDGHGAAVIRPDGSSAVEGALTPVSPRAMVGTAILRGQPGRIVRVELPRRIDLYSTGGGRISVEDVITDLPSLPKLDSAGTLTFRFGGRVRITGDSEGSYRGDLPITAEYQ